MFPGYDDEEQFFEEIVNDEYLQKISFYDGWQGRYLELDCYRTEKHPVRNRIQSFCKPGVGVIFVQEIHQEPETIKKVLAIMPDGKTGPPCGVCGN